METLNQTETFLESEIAKSLNCLNVVLSEYNWFTLN